MTTQEYNTSVASIIKIIVANNAGGVARALKQFGYPTKDFIPDAELESALFQLNTIAPEKFYQVLKNVQWNYGNNNGTNDPKNLDPIIQQLSKETGTTVLKSNWWQTAVNLLRQSFKNNSSVSKPITSSPWKTYLVLGISAFIIISIVYYAIK